MLQAEDRAYRLGQQKDVFVYNLQSVSREGEPTVEQFVFQVLEKKRTLVMQTIEGAAEELDEVKARMYLPSFTG